MLAFVHYIAPLLGTAHEYMNCEVVPSERVKPESIDSGPSMVRGSAKVCCHNPHKNRAQDWQKGDWSAVSD